LERGDLTLVDRGALDVTLFLTCFSPKFTIEGVSRLDSVFNTTSIPLRLANATTLLELPKSRPTTDILLFFCAGAAFLQEPIERLSLVCGVNTKCTLWCLVEWDVGVALRP
jgi:hypothetical protein